MPTETEPIQQTLEKKPPIPLHESAIAFGDRYLAIHPDAAVPPDLTQLVLPPNWRQVYHIPTYSKGSVPEGPTPRYRSIARLPAGPDPQVIIHLDNRAVSAEMCHLTIELPAPHQRSNRVNNNICRRHGQALGTIHDYMLEFNQLYPRWPDESDLRPTDHWLNDFLEYELLRRACQMPRPQATYRVEGVEEDNSLFEECEAALTRLRRATGFAGPIPTANDAAPTPKTPYY